MAAPVGAHARTPAAEALDLSRAMVSRHLESLERWLGARLLHRTTRRVSLSQAGQEALPRLRQMLELAADVQAVAGARRTEPTGKLRITTSLSFAVSSLTRAIVEFQTQFPRIEVDLLTVDRAVDLVAERIDLAARITNRLGRIDEHACLPVSNRGRDQVVDCIGHVDRRERGDTSCAGGCALAGRYSTMRKAAGVSAAQSRKHTAKRRRAQASLSGITLMPGRHLVDASQGNDAALAISPAGAQRHLRRPGSVEWHLNSMPSAAPTLPDVAD